MASIDNAYSEGSLPAFEKRTPIHFWGIAGVLYAIVTIYWPRFQEYWPRFQEYFPSVFSRLRSFDLFVIILLFLTLFKAMYRREPFYQKDSGILLSLCLILVARLLSVAFSPHFSPDLFLSVGTFVEAFVVCSVFISLIGTRFRRSVVLTLVLITLFETMIGAGQFISSGGNAHGVGIASLRGVGELQILLALWGLIAFCENAGNKILNILMFVVGAAGVFIAYLTTAYVQLLVAVIVGYFLLVKRVKRKYGWTVIIVSVIAIALFLLSDVHLPLATWEYHSLITRTGSVGFRVVLWKGALVAFASSPIVGVGSGVFGREQLAYLEYANVWFKEGYSLRQGFSAHNTVLGFLAETGLVGLAAYITYAVATIKAAFRVSRIAPTVFHKALAATVVSGIVLDIVAGSSFQPITMTLVALLASYDIEYRIVRQRIGPLIADDN